MLIKMANNSKVSKEHLHAFLRDNSTSSKFYIEYDDFLSNHLSHAAVALYHLGDTKQHFEEYLLRHYANKLEQKDGKTSKEQNASNVTDVSALVGKRQNYYQV